MSILTVRLNASDIKDIEFGIHYLNNKYFEKKVWPLDEGLLMLDGSALTMGEMSVKHLRTMWTIMIDDPNLQSSTWHDIEKNKKANLIIYIAKFKKLFSSRYYSNIDINYKKKDKTYNIMLGVTAGKKITDIYYNINELIMFQDNLKIVGNTEDAIKLYT